MYDPKFLMMNMSDVVDYVKSKIDNIDVNHIVSGHLDYREKMFEVMRLIDFGSDEKNYMTFNENIGQVST